MQKEKIITALKIAFILFLVAAISLLVIMRWKSDIIIGKVLNTVQHQLIDSLQYAEADMDWFSYFPSTAIRITDLKIGSGKEPLMEHGDLDIVIPLLPLLKNKIIIHRLEIKNGSIRIKQHQGHWSYEIFKAEEDKAGKSFNTNIRRLVIENTALFYDDGEGFVFQLAVSAGELKGEVSDQKLIADLELSSTLSGLVMKGYHQPESLTSTLTGQYQYDFDTGGQSFASFDLTSEVIRLTLDGHLRKMDEGDLVDLNLTWKKGDPESLKKWLPEAYLKQTKNILLSGEIEGEGKIEGPYSATESPHIVTAINLKKGGIDFLQSDEDLHGLTIDLQYDSGDKKTKQTSFAEITFEQGKLLGKSLKGQIKISHLNNPTYDISMQGTLPSPLLNLAHIPGLHFANGAFTIEKFELNGLRVKDASLTALLNKIELETETDDLQFTYHGTDIVIKSGHLAVKPGQLQFQLDQMVWNKATIHNLTSIMKVAENQIDFQLKGELCEGEVVAEGTISGIDQRPVSTVTWHVSQIEIKSLLESFSNFDQTFITTENLSGKTNIWAETTIPLNEKWDVVTNKVMMQAAFEMNKGQLKGMQVLEGFSKFIHLDDLRDIRFNQLRNYMKIENGKVYLPVMFIQSNALNLSISGEHSFNQEILYFLKLNVGQVAASKLKKNDERKEFKPASKSGWINMYYVLSGTATDVKYQQYRASVIAGFENSAALKDRLRDELVAKFGYDLYWIEPNEWEDIPEYR